jgi:cobalt-zinc-cadmium efflux system outer membrane protein
MPPPAPPAAPSASPIPNEGQGVYALGDLVRLMEQNHPVLRRDLAMVEEARGTALQAGLAPNPRLDFINPWQFGGRNSEYSAGLTQLVITGGKLKLDRAAAQEAVRQAELTYSRDRFDLLHGVWEQFYAVLAAQERTRVLTQTERIVEKAEQTGQRLLQGGQGNRTDVLALQIEARRVDVALRNSLVMQETGKQQLAAYVGLPELKIVRVDGSLYANPPAFDADFVRATVRGRNAQIEIAQVEIQRRQYLLERARVEWYPDLTAQAGYQFFDTAPKNQLLLYGAGALPIWNRNQGGIVAAAAGLNGAVNSVSVTTNTLLQSAADALGRYQTGLQQSEAYRFHILKNAIEALQLARSGYEKGEFDFPRYLTAQRTLVDAQLDYINTLDNLWNAVTDIAQLIQMDVFNP